MSRDGNSKLFFRSTEYECTLPALNFSKENRLRVWFPFKVLSGQHLDGTHSGNNFRKIEQTSHSCVIRPDYMIQPQIPFREVQPFRSIQKSRAFRIRRKRKRRCFSREPKLRIYLQQRSWSVLRYFVAKPKRLPKIMGTSRAIRERKYRDPNRQNDRQRDLLRIQQER